MQQDTEARRGIQQRAAALGRYEALKVSRPEMFAGEGPIAIADPTSDPHAGVVYVDPWIMLVVDAVTMPDGRPGTYTRVHYASAGRGVAVLPVMGDQVVLLRHWRHATRSWHLEIPRGFGEDDATDAQQAAAELLQETGLTADITMLGTMRPDTGALGFEVALAVAHVQQGQTPIAAEGLAEIVTMGVDAFEDAIADGMVDDGFTIAAWARWSLSRKRAART